MQENNVDTLAMAPLLAASRCRQYRKGLLLTPSLSLFFLGDKSTDYANFYQGLWDCTGALSDELSFKRSDVIYILSKEYNRYGWWVGEMRGAISLVPKAYLLEMFDI